MQNCLAIDVAKGKSMVSFIGSCSEVLIYPYEINHSINALYSKMYKRNLRKTKINKLDCISLAELGNINRFNNIKELITYCGLDQSIKQS